MHMPVCISTALPVCLTVFVFSLWPHLCICGLCAFCSPHIWINLYVYESVHVQGNPSVAFKFIFTALFLHVLCWESSFSGWFIRGCNPTDHSGGSAQQQNRSWLCVCVFEMRWVCVQGRLEADILRVRSLSFSLLQYAGRDSWKGNEPPNITWLTHLRRILPFNTDAKCKQWATGWVLFNHPCLGG